MNKKIKFGVYVGVTAVCLVLLILTVISSITLLSEKLDEGNMGQSIEDYDYDLYNGEYESMRDSLSFYLPEGEEFDPYWDVADAYRYYSQYEFWTLAAEQGLDTRENAQRYLELLQDVYESSGSQARDIIDDFAGELVS